MASYNVYDSRLKATKKIFSPNGDLLLFAEKEVSKKSRAELNCARWRSSVVGGAGMSGRYSHNAVDQWTSPGYAAAQRRKFRGPSHRSKSKGFFLFVCRWVIWKTNHSHELQLVGGDETTASGFQPPTAEEFRAKALEVV